jgi:hypothetical protein
MGAPNKEVIALMGRVYSLVGNWAMLSQINIIMAPLMATAGTNILWSEVLKNSFVKCGTARPIKAIGPEKAVITPVNKLVEIKVKFRVRFTLTPMLFA